MRYQITSFELLKQMLHQLPKGNACLEWPRSRNQDGYGDVYIEGGLRRGAHRVAYELVNGAICSNEIKVCHRCDNPACFHPRHLFLGTDTDNARDSATKGRRNRPSGQANPKAKLTEEQVHEIRRLLADKQMSGVDIAARYGVGPLAIYRIKSGASWVDGCHLENPTR